MECIGLPTEVTGDCWPKFTSAAQIADSLFCLDGLDGAARDSRALPDKVMTARRVYSSYQREEPCNLQTSTTPTPAAHAPSATAARASLLVLGMAAFMVQANARVIDPLLRVIGNEFHVHPARASIVASAYLLSYGLLQLFYGPLGDRNGKLRVMTVTLGLFAIGTLACGFVGGLMSFAVVRYLTGAVAAAAIPLSLGYIGDKFPYEQRQAALGRFMSALMMGQIVGSALGGVFGQFLGWRNVFILLGAASIVATVLLGREAARVPEEPKLDRKLGAPLFAVPVGGTMIFIAMLRLLGTAASWALAAVGIALLGMAVFTQYGGLLRRRLAPIILGAVLLEGFFVFGGLQYLAASLNDRFGIAPAAAGLMLMGFGIGGLLYSLSVVKLVKGIGELGILALGGSLLGFAFAAIGLMPAWGYFLPLVVVLGTGYYTMHGTLQTRATELAPEARGTAVSLFAFFFFMGQAAGPLALGAIVQSRGYPAAFVAAGAGLFVLAVIARALFARYGRKPVAAPN
jgi:MFS transporter, YNFM family, putative membrane transport protein